MDFSEKARQRKMRIRKSDGRTDREGAFTFMIPIFLGQLLQQLYNMADAWVVGNYASNDAFAAVSLSGNVTMSVITLFGGIAIGGGVVISKYFGAQDEENLRAVHELPSWNRVFSRRSSVRCLSRSCLLHTPDSVMTEALTVLWNLFCRRFHGHHVQHLHEHHAGGRGQRTSTLLPDLFLRGEHDPGSHFVAGFKWSAAGAADRAGLSVLYACHAW